MERFFWICLAGTAGTNTRYLIAIQTAQRFNSAFPFSTLIVNLSGCFVIATLMHTTLTLSWSPTIHSTVTIRFIKKLTTYSSFNYETMRLFEKSTPTTATVNLAFTILKNFATN